LRAQYSLVRALLALLLLISGVPAAAAELVVTVRQPNGAPVANAVVSLYPGGRPAPLAPPAGVYKVAQKDTQFHPFVLVVPVGATVAFPNYDAFRHHVYSFSPAKRFELKLYAREQNRTVRFDRAGVVPLGCNIHDQMTAFIKVSDTGRSPPRPTPRARGASPMRLRAHRWWRRSGTPICALPPTRWSFTGRSRRGRPPRR
jgi:plastocyanin